jgi:cell division protein ZipA
MHAKLGDEEFYVAPESEGVARASAVLPMKPSEDASHLLRHIKVAGEEHSEEPRDYLPDEKVDWVVNVTFDVKSRVDPKTVREKFDRAWRDTFGRPTEYGRNADTGYWTYLISGDGPKAVTDLKLAWDFVDPLVDDQPPPSVRIFEQRLAEVTKRLKSFGAAKVTASLSPTEAAQRTEQLQELKARCAYDVVVVLQAPPSSAFDGRQIWDVMLCLGLKWGDMDCFHWDNRSNVGHDRFFSVSTSTSPGYFLPEEIAAGRVRVKDLVFSFSAPRSAAPAEVFDRMLKAVKYCQQRLGGEILGESGQPIDASKIRKQVTEVESSLREAGFPTGCHSALRLF